MADEGGQTSVPNSLAQYSMMASVGCQWSAAELDERSPCPVVGSDETGGSVTRARERWSPSCSLPTSLLEYLCLCLSMPFAGVIEACPP